MNNHYKAPDGYRYEKDCITTDELWLGINDSIENWTMITEEEARWIENQRERKIVTRKLLLIDSKWPANGQ